MRLRLNGITKRFGDLVANDRIDLVAEEGEIHALLGENGAGKTTLMNVLDGLYQPDEGAINLDDKPVRFSDPGDAIRAGIGMVHQNFMLIPTFTVAENVMLGFERTSRFGFLDRRRARAEIEELSKRFGLEVDPDAMVGELSVGQQQRVEIVKALARDAQVLILDEPTAVLTPQETEELFAVMRSLRSSGRTILFITHKLKEVLAIADRITVIRLGKVIGTTIPEKTGEQELAAMMVGRGVELQVAKAPAKPGEVVLEARGLTVVDASGALAVDGVSFDLRSGEILAVAGVQGNGQTELAAAVTGLALEVGGTVKIQGRDLTGEVPKAFLRAGVANVPEDRIKDGLVGDFSIAENLVLDVYDEAPYSRGGALDWKTIHATAEKRVAEFDIRAASIHVPAKTLSGGNQQKVIVARELSRDIKLIVAAQPTRGLDVGSIEYVHGRLVSARDAGAAVLLISAELDEVLALADRIVVMYRGRLVGPFPAGSLTREEIGLLMAGIHVEKAAKGVGM
ncbi:MAG TPA: ABC transporter ATP-binding protein [Rectinemataceae bacterium]|nr:ABC transporter ATP-binding protein [Rectinemataceae bacterium]